MISRYVSIFDVYGIKLRITHDYQEVPDGVKPPPAATIVEIDGVEVDPPAGPFENLWEVSVWARAARKKALGE